MISLRNIFDGKQVIEDDKITLIRSPYTHYKHFYVLVNGDSLFCDWLTADDLNCECLNGLKSEKFLYNLD